MDLIFILLTQLINETGFNLDFEVVNYRRRLLPRLRPGRTRFAKVSRVRRRLRRLEPGWKFLVLLNEEFTGIEMDPQLIVDCVRVVFRVDGDGDGEVLCVDGVHENHSSDLLFRLRFFGCMRKPYWDRRKPIVSIDRSDTKLATKLRNAEGDCQHLAPFVDLENGYESPLKKSPKKKKGDHKYKEGEIKGSPAQQPRPRPKPKPENGPRPPSPAVGSKTPISIDDSEINDKSVKTKKATKTDPQVGPTRDVTRHLDPPMKIGGNGTGRPQPYDVAPSQRARPIYYESSTNMVEMDSFVHGMFFVFALIVCIWMKFYF